MPMAPPIFDATALIRAFITALLAAFPDFATVATDTFASLIDTRATATWQSIGAGVLNADTNFLTRTPPALSYNLGGVTDLYRAWEPAIFGLGTLSCVLAGIAAVGREYFAWSWAPGEWGARFFIGILLGLSMPRFYVFTIDLTNRICDAIVSTSLPSLPSGPMDPIAMAVLVVVWVVLGIRLLWRMAYRLIYFDILLILGPLAVLMAVLPGGQRYASMWWRAYIGLLVGQVLVVICLRLAAALGSPGGGTWGGIALGIGVLLLAYDLAVMLAEIRGGGLVGVVATTVRVMRRAF